MASVKNLIDLQLRSTQTRRRGELRRGVRNEREEAIERPVTAVMEHVKVAGQDPPMLADQTGPWCPKAENRLRCSNAARPNILLVSTLRRPKTSQGSNRRLGACGRALDRCISRWQRREEQMVHNVVLLGVVLREGFLTDVSRWTEMVEK